MERKKMTAEDIRKQFGLTKQALINYLNLGVLTPVPGTENNKNPEYYTDEVAVIREALTTCESSIKRLNAIHDKVNKEIFKSNAALDTLHLDEATKEGATKTIMDAIELFLTKAVPKLDKCKYPMGWLRWSENRDFERWVDTMKDGRFFHTPQDYCNELYHEVDAIDATSLLNVIAERDALLEERDCLREQVKELKQKLALLKSAPEAKEVLSNQGYRKVLSAKQVAGIKTSIYDCDFTVRVLRCLRFAYCNDKEINTLEDVVRLTPSEMKKIRNFGKQSLAEITAVLAKYDLKLGMDVVEIDGTYYSK